MREALVVALSVFAVVAVAVATIKFWRYKNRDFRAAVVIENLRLWREIEQDYRNKHPFEAYDVDVATAACYHALQSGRVQKAVLTRAWDNVKAMSKFFVQECCEGKNVRMPEVVYANSDLEAARTVVPRDNLRHAGKLGELRVRVRDVNRPATDVCFYSDPHIQGTHNN